MPVVLMLACAAAGALLFRKFNAFRSTDPDRAQMLSYNVNNAATLIGAVASAVSILLKALWGQPAPATSTVARIGEPVGN